MEINIFKTVTIIDRENSLKYINKEGIAKLPKSITAIGKEAFYCCEQLEKIDLSECEKLGTIGDGAFKCCPSLKEVKLPKSITAIGEEAFRICIYNHRTTKTNQKYPSVNL